MTCHTRLLPWLCCGAPSPFTLPHFTSNPTCWFLYAERLYFELYFQSTGEKTWGGCNGSAQEAGAINTRKKSQRLEVKKQGVFELSAGPSDTSNNEARQGITLPPLVRGSPRFSTIHSEIYLWSLHSIRLTSLHTQALTWWLSLQHQECPPPPPG